MSQDRKCRECGAEAQPGSDFCHRCVRKLEFPTDFNDSRASAVVDPRGPSLAPGMVLANKSKYNLVERCAPGQRCSASRP